MLHSSRQTSLAALCSLPGHFEVTERLPIVILFHPFLTSELERIQKEAIYQNRVFFIRNLGFITRTEARQITLDDALRFEKIHEQTYRDLGFELISGERGSLAERVTIIKTAIR